MRGNEGEKINGILPRRTCTHQKWDQTALNADLLIVHNLEALAASENKQNALVFWWKAKGRTCRSSLNLSRLISRYVCLTATRHDD